MEPTKLEQLSRLGGKVVELRLSDNRQAIGFLAKADNDTIVLHPIDYFQNRGSTVYRTPRVKDYDRLEKTLTLNLEMHPPPEGSRVVIRLKNSLQICGYSGKPEKKEIHLSREITEGGDHRRSHRHRPDQIETSFLLKPVDEA